MYDFQLCLLYFRFQGVPLSFGNIKCKRRYANILEEQPYLHFTCNAELVLFQPTIGAQLDGVVNKLGHDHVSCLVHGMFNAAIFMPRNNGVTWAGSNLKIGDSVTLNVTKIKNMNGVISLRGTIRFFYVLIKTIVRSFLYT